MIKNFDNKTIKDSIIVYLQEIGYDSYELIVYPEELPALCNSKFINYMDCKYQIEHMQFNFSDREDNMKESTITLYVNKVN